MVPFSIGSTLLALLLLICSLIMASGVENGRQIDFLDPQSGPITRISEAKNLIERCRNDNASDHCIKYKESFTELEPILSEFQSGHECSLDFVGRIRDYHNRFIAKASDDLIPIVLQRFFISLCFQASAQCKINLINNLDNDTKQKISDEDYYHIHLLERYGATLLDLNEEISDFDDIVMLNDLVDNEMVTSSGQQSRIVVKTKTNRFLKDLMDTCELKFKPFYDKLIVPLIKLSNLGYNYQGELLERELKEIKHNHLVRRWYNIVQMCESFRAFELYEDSEASESIASQDRQVLSFVGPEEAEMLRRKRLESGKNNSDQGMTAKPLEYNPVLYDNGDKLWITDQNELKKLVSKYKNEASEASRIQAKMMKKLFSKIKSIIMSGNIHLVASEIFQCNRRTNECDTEETSVEQDLVKMVDEAVTLNEHEKMAANGLAPLDSQVAGRQPKSLSTFGIPPKVRYVPKMEDQTKTTTKTFGWFRSFFPNKKDIVAFYGVICGFSLIMLALMITISGR